MIISLFGRFFILLNYTNKHEGKKFRNMNSILTIGDNKIDR